MKLDRPVLIHCCKDRTITYRQHGDRVFNDVALPVFSVDTVKEAEDLMILVCRKQYDEHPLLPGQPWYKITLDGNLDFKPYLDLEDLTEVSKKLETSYEILKARKQT